MLTFVYTTCATAEEARRIAEDMVEKKLAACAQVGAELQSVFRWNGHTDTATEVPLLLKTTPEKQEACCAHLTSLHAYETPAIEFWTVQTTPETAAWAHRELA